MPKGYLSLVLHSHLPFVRHPEYEDFLEEDWLYEAIFETYIPLIEVFDKLLEDKVSWKLTMSLTPTLITMLTDPLLQERALKHINRLIELIDKEVERTKNDSRFNKIAKMYQEKFLRYRYVFAEKYNRNLVNAFKKFQDAGDLEIITCSATHCFLPLTEVYPVAVKAQIKIAVDLYKKHLGRPPVGIWLPECGYHPGHDYILRDFGIKYFFLDSHGILFGKPKPKYGVFAPVYCKSGVAAFGRDIESSKQVWSAKEGYPGDYEYRDFYRDVGFDLDYEYIKNYVHPDGQRIFTGIKYYKITGETVHKEPYVPERAMEKAASHAGNFMFNREKQIEYLAGVMDRPPIIVAPYDAELYGHWWYEGPDWLNFLIRKMCYDQDNVKLITPSIYLKRFPKNQVITPSMSSWGYKGYSEVWLEGSNDWIYRHIHKATERMIELSNANGSAGGSKKRALNQALRELLLAQSSDWAFIMKTGTHVEYAVKRTKEHILNFTRLYDEIKSNSLDESWISYLESKNNIFPDIDYKIYRT